VSLLLLDTTFLVDAERGGLDIDSAIDDGDDVAVDAVSVVEMLVGVELASARHRPRRQAFVDDLVSSTPIVPYDLSVAGEHAKLLAAVKVEGRPRGAHDLIIAATARATGRKVITADPGAFDGLPGVSIHTHRSTAG
jgi:tRNA(fMet)-specific endonuclease VapC